MKQYDFFLKKTEAKIVTLVKDDITEFADKEKCSNKFNSIKRKLNNDVSIKYVSQVSYPPPPFLSLEW